jgi:hypothetical protein
VDPIAIIGYISLVVGAILSLASRIPKQTIANQKELIDTYEKRLKALEDQTEVDRKQHIENVKAIAELQGQIRVYKELPLQEMASAMQEISQVNKTIAASNQLILERLDKSAITLAHDRVEDQTTQTIKEQTVQKQIVRKKE